MRVQFLSLARLRLHPAVGIRARITLAQPRIDPLAAKPQTCSTNLFWPRGPRTIGRATGDERTNRTTRYTNHRNARSRHFGAKPEDPTLQTLQRLSILLSDMAGDHPASNGLGLSVRRLRVQNKAWMDLRCVTLDGQTSQASK